ncbi:MAG: hypothetical protein COY58_09300 [Gammaproteobacteria bacterium CG_4_10_14_0_8_um_filter_38_16]|nr:MAG: hypothetical protein COY58_09300 [Gammaproteobacteria bacterium CG_4_10_14_0_8_um_filter_38_16]PJA03569.1 MAG: hypothetical protein COX72_04500 [Gammaproteobacteria bacterium CG_4_10_14_0_2_um_filter_38_22]PJB10138.1 MAG: hypothetical protein CO120_06410 [Gammaproteobacteria bacterium CG_4_9_14_3_um_filter_38_9]
MLSIIHVSRALRLILLISYLAIITKKHGIENKILNLYFCEMDRTGRQPRIHIPNTIHHVMIRGNNRQRIFHGDIYFFHFLELLAQSAEQFDHKIIAYCLMSNHVHLLIHIHDSPLSAIMKNINFRYARWVNHKQNRIGHLFQGRYRSLEVNNDEYLVNLCRYIHFNPVAAKIVDCMEDYPWTSHRYYTGCEARWMDIHLMCEAIQRKTNFSYSEFINKPVDRDAWKPAITISEAGEIIYDKDTIWKQQENAITSQIIRKFLTQDEVSAIVCNNLDIQKTELFVVSRNRKHAKQRILLAYYLIRYSKINITGVAKLFRCTHGTLSRQLANLDRYSEKYFSLGLLQNIEETLNRAAIN